MLKNYNDCAHSGFLLFIPLLCTLANQSICLSNLIGKGTQIYQQILCFSPVK